jgi:hypothetical protein
MLKFFLITLLFCINLFALSVSSDDDYKIIKNKKYNIIYTGDYIEEVKFLQKNLDNFLAHNDKTFGFSFDEPLRLVLISDNIQIPNAFSTQVPFNLGIYFNGGAGMNDYFSTKSWLETLLVHEMVHNYQINAKKDKISKTLHKYLGNNYMPILAGIIPFFTLPNLLLPTPILEGNSVLNESVYGNGGRLHSGVHNAQKNSLVFQGKITPTTFINDHLTYPYTTEKYIVGGFYMAYLASRFGFDRVNHFFYNHSFHSINPFLLHRSFRNNFGISFSQSVYEFVAYTKMKYSNYKELNDGKIINSSYTDIKLSKVDGKIYFITSNLVTKKELNSYDVKTNVNKIEDTNLLKGKVFIKNGKKYTASNAYISSKKYKFGLFDEDKYIEKTTIGKDVQDIYKDKIAYIDIKKSFLNTKLYIDGEYYSDIASSALFDDSGNIYYFKQEGEVRELYKNKTKLFEFRGYYSKIVDIVKGSIYFVSNSDNGSALYEFDGSNIYKLNNADNIIDGKIIDKNNALVVTTNAYGYNVVEVSLDKLKVISLPQAKVFQLKKPFKFNRNYKDETLKASNYNEIQELQYSMLYPYYAYDSTNGSNYGLTGVFMDAVMFNMVNLYLYKDSELKLAGGSYTNERYIPFRINLFDVDREIKYIKERGYGGSLELYGPLIRTGRHELYANVKYYLDDENKDKNPTVAKLEHTYEKRFVLENYPFLKSTTDIVVKKDREDLIYGAGYRLDKHLFSEIYMNAEIKKLDSDIDSLGDDRGIKVVTKALSLLEDNTNQLIEGSDFAFYVKDFQKASIGLSKTFYGSVYFYNFPLSLRKESLFYQYNHFDITSLKSFEIKEHIVGLNLDFLVAHKLPIPLSIKYIENDFSKNEYKVKVEFGVQF